MREPRATRVLLIDALEDDRDIYSRGLEQLGFAVELASTAAEALEVAAATRPEVIVLHVTADDAGDSGWGTCDALRRMSTTAGIPVVILTAAVRPDRANRDRARAMVNCAAFVGKPCDHERLALILQQVLEGQRGIEHSHGTLGR